MKTHGLFLAVGFFSAIVASHAVTIKLSGTYIDNFWGLPPYKSFGFTINYDPAYVPHYLPAGTVISDGGTKTAPLLQDFYLFPSEGITGFSAFADSVTIDSSVSAWAGSDMLWFEADIRTPGAQVHDILFYLAGPGLSIGFGSLFATPYGMEYWDDVFIHSGGKFGYSQGDYRIQVTPESGSLTLVLWLAWAGLAWAGAVSRRSGVVRLGD